MRVGITGTRQGMTMEQLASFKKVLPKETTEFHHGSATGVDEEAAYYVWSNFKAVRVISYPSTIRSLVSDLVAECYHVKHKPKSPLDRNKDIVRNSDLLIACPKESEEILKSGSWATIRAARREGIPIIYIWPDGSVTDTRVTGSDLPTSPDIWRTTT